MNFTSIYKNLSAKNLMDIEGNCIKSAGYDGLAVVKMSAAIESIEIQSN